VACGCRSVVRTFADRLDYAVGVDIYKPAIEEAKALKVHDTYVLMDVMKIDRKFQRKSFDCVLAVDIIEHLPKKDAISLINKAETVAKRIVILQTTNGFFHQEETDGNKYQKHQCGFEVAELQKLGYTVWGLDGPKALWRIKLRFQQTPFIYLFDGLCLALDPLMRHMPSYCHTLLAYKKLNS